MKDCNSIKPLSKGKLNKTHKNYTDWGTCWKCGEFGHLAKECKIIPMTSNQFDITVQDQTMINYFRNSQSGSPTPQTTRQIQYANLNKFWHTFSYHRRLGIN